MSDQIPEALIRKALEDDPGLVEDLAFKSLSTGHGIRMWVDEQGNLMVDTDENVPFGTVLDDTGWFQ